MSRKVYCKMLSQDIYLREHSPLAERDITIPKQEKYLELRRDTVADGIREHYEEVEYPITAETVNSHVQSADYRNDVVAAVNQPPRGANLGDLTAYQNFIAQNPAEALRVYQETIAKLAQAVPVEQPVPENDKNGGDK